MIAPGCLLVLILPLLGLGLGGWLGGGSGMVWGGAIGLVAGLAAGGAMAWLYAKIKRAEN